MRHWLKYLLIGGVCLVAESVSLRADDLFSVFGDAEQTGRAFLAPAPLPAPEVAPVPEPVWPSIVLPALEEELALHGGSSLYEPSDLADSWYLPEEIYAKRLRLSEDWVEPQPLSRPGDYLGSELIQWNPQLKWFGENGYMWEPRFVGYGSYELFGAVFKQGDRRRNGIGHQLILDFDLALTGTERIHMQFRPLGGKNSGGSFWQFNNPAGYDDNSDGVPQTWWFEGELQSILGAFNRDPRLQWDMNITAGKFPFQLHNSLLMNDEIVGVVLGKNDFTSTPLSNLNTQIFYAIDDIDSVPSASDLVGIHFQGDYRHIFLEATYAHLFQTQRSRRDSDYLALSATKFLGPVTLAGRVMHKGGDSGGIGSGQLYVLESNFTREPGEWFQHLTGIELAVAYVNLFKATSGWSPISGGRFDRLRNTFTLNPLLNIAAGRPAMNTQGAAAGVQIFRCRQDESFIPEFVVEQPDLGTVWGAGLRYQRKLTSRMYFEARGLKTWSEVSELERAGAFLSTFVLF